MKHILTILTAIALCSLPFTAQAQSEEDYLPKAGDLGLSVSANPLSQIATGVPFTSTQPLVSIAGKYMVSDKSALFLNVGWIYNYNHNNYYANDDAALYLDPFSRAKVIDTRENQITGLNVSFGGERRIGKGKVQGVFGGGIMYAFSYYDIRYSYGNAITSINQQPTNGFTDIYGNNDGSDVPSPNVPGVSYQRYLNKFNTTPTHYIGLTGYAGVEWFVAPKVSVGAKLYLTAAYRFLSGDYYTAEGYNYLTGQVEEWTELLRPSSHGFSFNRDNVGMDISFNFYF